MNHEFVSKNIKLCLLLCCSWWKSWIKVQEQHYKSREGRTSLNSVLESCTGHMLKGCVRVILSDPLKKNGMPDWQQYPLNLYPTGCPKKHGNSVTNSISSLQIILWFSIVIPTEKAEICKSFFCYVYILFVYVLTATGCT